MANAEQFEAELSEDCHTQTGGTCYANAIATVTRATLNRIYGRHVPPHEDIVTQIVEFDANGYEGPDYDGLETCLSDECKRRHIEYREVQLADVPKIVSRNRPVLLAFTLDNNQWAHFTKFFKDNPTGVLNQLPTPNHNIKSGGHAVVVKSVSANSWVVKNSWGKNWAEAGCFIIHPAILKNALTLVVYDVYWVTCLSAEKLIWEKLPDPEKNRWKNMKFTERREYYTQWLGTNEGEKARVLIDKERMARFNKKQEDMKEQLLREEKEAELRRMQQQKAAINIINGWKQAETSRQQRWKMLQQQKLKEESDALTAQAIGIGLFAGAIGGAVLYWFCNCSKKNED